MVRITFVPIVIEGAMCINIVRSYLKNAMIMNNSKLVCQTKPPTIVTITIATHDNMTMYHYMHEQIFGWDMMVTVASSLFADDSVLCEKPYL